MNVLWVIIGITIFIVALVFSYSSSNKVDNMEEWDEYLAVVVGKQEYVEQDNAIGVFITVRTPDKDYTLKVDKESFNSLSLFDTVSILVSPKGEAVLGTRDKPHQLIIHNDEK